MTATDDTQRLVIDGQVLGDDEPRGVAVPEPRGAHALGRRCRAAVHVVTNLPETGPAATTRRAVTTAGRKTARVGYVTGRGVWSWMCRAAMASTFGTHREHIRAAKQAGDHEAAGVWADRLEKAKNGRRARLQTLPRQLMAVAIASGVAVAAAVALLVLGGLTAQLVPGGATWTSWWAGVGAVARMLVAVGWWLAVLALCCTPVVAAALAWREGQRVAPTPAWLMSADERADWDTEITPAKLVLAFAKLGIAPLTTAIKAMPDGGAAMLSPIHIAGRGVEVDVSLPAGVNTRQIQDRRQPLAENLDRHRHELFISIPPAPRTVRLWMADRGALDQPIGKSPMVVDPPKRTNVRTGRAPWGEDLRGNLASLSLYQCHLLVTGLSNQGKTLAVRSLALWAAHDPTARFLIADLKGPKDWRMFDGIADELIIGPTDDHVIRATEMVERAAEEMERRTQAGGTHPKLFVIIDEAQVAYMCPEKDEQGNPYGGKSNRSRYFMAIRRVQNQGRAVDVLIWEGTQDPTDQNLPKLTREGKHIRASLVVGTESQARMALGEAAVDGGAAPHELRQGLDKGTLVVTGAGVDLPPGETSVTVRTYFIPDHEATDLAEHAKKVRNRSTRPLYVVPDTKPTIDHLANIHVAMQGEPRVRTTVVLERLAGADPDEYEPWTHEQLTAFLERWDAAPVKSNGRMVVRLDLVDEAFARRDTGEASDEAL